MTLGISMGLCEQVTAVHKNLATDCSSAGTDGGIPFRLGRQCAGYPPFASKSSRPAAFDI
jgi:hypothetical protein